MAEALEANITGSGINQGDLVKFLGNVRDLVNEIQADHATTKTTVDAARTAIIELIDDHATNKVTMDESRTAIIELIDDHATFKTVVDDLKTLVNILRGNLIALYTKMDADFADVTNASTDYAAVLGSGGSDPSAVTAAVASSSPATLTAGDPTASAATLTAPDPAAGPAALAASTALTLAKG